MTENPVRHIRTLIARRLPAPLAALLVATLVQVMAATPATGQAVDSSDSRWLPWSGCWRLVEETGALPDEIDERRAFADRVVVCVTPAAGTQAVEVATFADGTQILLETLQADAIDHAVTQASCNGHRRDSWSADGARLFTRADLTCEDGGQRSVSGVGLMASPTTWLDIQLVETEGRGAVTIRRYIRAGRLAIEEAGAVPLTPDRRERALDAARLVSSAGLDITDVIEAHHLTESAVVEAMLVETGPAFALDGRALLDLDDAGLPDDLIDLMVALSFPDEFAVRRPAGRAYPTSVGGAGGFASSYDPFLFDQWYPYYASPFGYYYGWSPFNSLYYLGPAYSYGILPYGVLQGSDPAEAQGRFYNGRGYSRTGAQAPTVQRRARDRNDPGVTAGLSPSSGGSSRGASAGASSGGGGGRITPGGYTSGGRAGSSGSTSSGSTGRTARPRNP